MSIDDTIKSNVTLTTYPNPVKDVLYLKSETKIDKIVIFDLNGRKVLEKEWDGIDKINVESLVKGIYVIQIYARNEEKSNSLKFIKY